MIDYAGLMLAVALIAIPFIACCLLVFKSIRDADKIRRLNEQLRFTESKSAGLEHAAVILAEQVRDFGAMKEQQDIIALHLRENCKAQIAAGLHNGRGLGEIVVAYLSGHMPDAAVLPAPGPPQPIPENLRHLIDGPVAPVYGAGQKVEVALGLEWLPAIITRGPIELEDEVVWEVQIFPPDDAPSFLSARNEQEMRPTTGSQPVKKAASGACCRFHDSGGALGFVTDCPRFQGVDRA